MWDLWLAVTSRRRVVGCSSQWLWVSRLTLRAVITVWRVLLDCACAGWYLAGRIRNYYCLCRVYRYDLYASLVFDSQPVAADCEQKWVREREANATAVKSESSCVSATDWMVIFTGLRLEEGSQWVIDRCCRQNLPSSGGGGPCHCESTKSSLT